MLTSEEMKVLRYLGKHRSASPGELARVCLAGAVPPGWLERVVANLDWLGYVAVLPGAGGGFAALQITQKGLDCVAAGVRSRTGTARVPGRLPAG